jgi:hypothetical protein
MMRKTRFNHWINLHLGVLDEIKIKFQNKYKIIIKLLR